MNRKFLLLLLPLTLAILVILDPFSVDRLPIDPQVEDGIFLAEDAEPNALAHPRWDARSGPEWQRWFFADWHYPYGAVLPLSVEWDIWSQIRRLPLDTGDKFVDSWELLGPSGVTTPTGAIYSGRILDLDALAGPELTIAAASGGLWQYVGFTPAPLTDELSTQWVSTLAFDPNDDQTILIGTGEYFIRGGRGVFKSTNGGASWGHRIMTPNPGVVFRIRYGSDGNTVHAVTDLGYYRSTDDGDTWTRIFFQDPVTDIAVVPAVPTPGPPDPDVLYVTAWDEGLYLSIDAGLNWGKAIAGGIPTSDVARGAVSVCAADHGVIYTAFAQQSFEVTDGDTMFSTT